MEKQRGSQELDATIPGSVCKRGSFHVFRCACPGDDRADAFGASDHRTAVGRRAGAARYLLYDAKCMLFGGIFCFHQRLAHCGGIKWQMYSDSITAIRCIWQHLQSVWRFYGGEITKHGLGQSEKKPRRQLFYRLCLYLTNLPIALWAD